MAEKKLLNVVFRPSPDSDYSLTLGSISSDNVPTPNPTVEYEYADKSPEQAGCQIWNQNGGGPLIVIEQTGLYEAFTKTGYAGRAAILPIAAMENVKLYLNGFSHDPDNNPQPYVVFEHQSGDYGIQLHYYMADNTHVGLVFTTGYFGGTAHNHCSAFFGKLYIDGTTSAGQIAIMRPKLHGAGYSSKTFYWTAEFQVAEGTQLINADVIDDLAEYMPITPEEPPDDTGEGDFDSSSDPIGIPGLPSKSPLSSGLVNMYLMSSGELNSLKTVLWDPNGLVANLLAMFQNPMEGIINLSLCPVTIDAQYQYPMQSVIVGNFTFPGFTSTQITYPYKQFNFGTIYVNEFWGNFADYSPYTKMSIFLPYIGVQSISIDDVMNGGVQLRANVDVFTGAIQYFLFSAQRNGRNHGHNSVLYSWTGNMKYSVPLTGSDFNSAIIRTIANTATTAGSMLASGISQNAANSSGGLSIINPLNMLGQASVFSRGGGSGGAPGILGIQTPYLILERPELTMAQNYEHTLGTPNESTDYLKNYLNNFVKVKGIHMEISSATSEELNEIESLLMGGVIV